MSVGTPTVATARPYGVASVAGAVTGTLPLLPAGALSSAQPVTKTMVTTAATTSSTMMIRALFIPWKSDASKSRGASLSVVMPVTYAAIPDGCCPEIARRAAARCG
jgi:hypothetical protein